jgi:hypothetical protein
VVAADDHSVTLRLLGSALLAGGALAFAGPASAAPAPLLWSATKADAVLLLKLRLPCASIRSAGACRVASAATYRRKGFPLRTADCKGGGAPDRTGTRFGVFTCRITVYDDTNPTAPVDVSGRLLITVTGSTTFSWRAI